MIKHGFFGTFFYKKWAKMKERCLNKNCERYPIYGGRGIKVCDKWLEFIGFKEDMYESYLAHVKEYGEKDTTIDRIDVNGDYCKENCRWVTMGEQCLNKQNTILYNGKTLKQICEDFSMPYKIIWQRIYRDGMSLDKALSTSLDRKLHIEGLVVGDFLIVERESSKTSPYYKCRCIKCGMEVYKYWCNLRRGLGVRCNCIKNTNMII